MAINKIERYGWEYSSDDSILNGGYKIVSSEKDKRPIPKTLYKYYALTNDSIDAITNQYLYAPHPYQLNDLYDCSESLILYDNIEAVKRFFKGIITVEEIEAGFRNNDKQFFKMIQFNLNVLFFSRIATISFTEDKLSIPMWSYYTNNKGFAVEFDYSKFTFNWQGPFQINYQNDIKPVSIHEGWDLCFLFQSNVKTTHWAHELEWRIIVEKKKTMEMEGIKIPSDVETTNRKFQYNTSAIKRIILGNKFFNEDETKLMINQGQSSTAKINDDATLKYKLLKFIQQNRIPTYIIAKDLKRFKLREVQFTFNDDNTIDRGFIEPLII